MLIEGGAVPRRWADYVEKKFNVEDITEADIVARESDVWVSFVCQKNVISGTVDVFGAVTVTQSWKTPWWDSRRVE